MPAKTNILLLNSLWISSPPNGLSCYLVKIFDRL